MSNSADIVIDIDYDSEYVSVVVDGRLYNYRFDEVDTDFVDSMIGSGATYTVYAQNEDLTEEEYEEIIADYGTETALRAR